MDHLLSFATHTGHNYNCLYCFTFYSRY